MQQNVQVLITNKSANPLPEYATIGSSGLDIRANLTEPLILQPLQRVAVPTGIYVAIPQGYEIQVRPRSGLALNQGITCLNTPGTIDSDYRGEIKVLLINLSKETQIIVNADRIAQLVLQKVEPLQWIVTNTLHETDRGEKGFGHSGKQ